MENEVDTKSTFLRIYINDKLDRVECYCHGRFPVIDEVSEEIITLHELSTSYSTLMLFINSPGGVVNTFVELAGVCKKYDEVITVNTGECSSAGLTLWAIGDYRLAYKHSQFMYHRESYALGYDKTSNHRDFIEFNDKVYQEMSSDVLDSIITPEEFELGKRSEVWLSYSDLIGRGSCILWDDYIHRQKTYEPIECFTIDGVTFIADGEDNYIVVDKVECSNTYYKGSDIMYGAWREKVEKLSPEDKARKKEEVLEAVKEAMENGEITFE